MREKLLAKLKAQYPGLSNTLLGLLADKGLAKVTEDSQIEGYIAELEALPISPKDFQVEGDRRVTDAQRKWDDEHKKPEPPKPAEEPKKDDNDPLQKRLDELDAKLAAFEAKENKVKAQEKLSKALSDKKIPAVFAKGRVVEKEEDVETILAEIETDFTAFKQDLTDQGLYGATAPVGGASVTGKADDKEVSSIVDNLMPNV